MIDNLTEYEKNEIINSIEDLNDRVILSLALKFKIDIMSILSCKIDDFELEDSRISINGSVYSLDKVLLADLTKYVIEERSKYLCKNQAKPPKNLFFSFTFSTTTFTKIGKSIESALTS